MAEPNLINNGRFTQELQNWEVAVGSPSWVANQGYAAMGSVQMPAYLDEIRQSFTIARDKVYTLGIALRASAALMGTTNSLRVQIRDKAANLVLLPSWSLFTVAADTWEINRREVYLGAGRQYQIEITNRSQFVGATIFVDDVWLWPLAITRRQVAERIADKLGSLASDASLSTTPSGDKPEGDYTPAIDEALRVLGAVDTQTGKPDIRYIESEDVKPLLDLVNGGMLERLYNEYATQVDVAAGPIRESLSQRRQAIAEMMSGSAGGGLGPVVTRKLTREDWYK